jgi:hypothetical protein
MSPSLAESALPVIPSRKDRKCGPRHHQECSSEPVQTDQLFCRPDQNLRRGPLDSWLYALTGKNRSAVGNELMLVIRIVNLSECS